MGDQNDQQELLLNEKQLRFKIVRTAITLGVTFANLAQTEDSIGNLAQARWASDNAKRVCEEVHECLPAVQLSNEEMQLIQEKLNELEQAIDLKHG
jgi:hypothetical protein